ncbi:hypothetical protein [uncultured Dokdonia sp.]|uniref:IS1096 element passenger TnpR family protein n=1 Tax=uncultured Dokdonia sp. TaxID=575653 RepID=UPI002622FED5|nr:hypothetical protein [uncultured Dokdonia sp.]
MIYRFRVILDTEEDVFRDLEIDQQATLEDLHNAVNQSFGFDGGEMASFYKSDDQWNQGQEISLFDMSEGDTDVRLMSETLVEDVISEAETRLLYVYDFLSMWRFMLELGEIAEREDGITYPNLMYVHGQIPDQAPEITFEAEESDDDIEFEDGLDIDDLDDLNFDQNWN